LQQPELVRKLQDTITDEVLRSAGLSPTGWHRRLIAPLVASGTKRFATLFAAFDLDVRQYGTDEGARRFLPHLVEGWRQSGAEPIPRDGPLLVAANHPGATDSVAIMASLPRGDLRIVISDVPFTRALPAGRDHLIYASPEADGRVRATREMIRHLRAGGSLLVFPGTTLDPDPALLPGASERLGAWSRSIALALRRVSETRLVGAIASGVLSPRFLSHPLIRLAPAGWQRFKLAEVLQILSQLTSGKRYGLTPRVTFGEPVTLVELRQRNGPGDDMAAIVAYAQGVLAAHLEAGDTPSLVQAQVPLRMARRRKA
jgi:hypothetical protein